MICNYYCSCCLFTTTEFLKEHWLSETSHTHLQYMLKIREEIESKRDALGFHGIQLFERLSVGVPAPKRMSAPGFARSNKEERPKNFGHKHRRKQLNYCNIDVNFLLFSVSYLRRLGTNGHKCRCNWKYLPTIETGNTKARILVSGHFEDTYWRGTHAYSEFFDEPRFIVIRLTPGWMCKCTHIAQMVKHNPVQCPYWLSTNRLSISVMSPVQFIFALDFICDVFLS